MSIENKVWVLYRYMGGGPWKINATFKSVDDARRAGVSGAERHRQALADVGRVGTYLYRIVEMDADLEPPTSDEVQALVDNEARTRPSNSDKFSLLQ